MEDMEKAAQKIKSGAAAGPEGSRSEHVVWLFQKRTKKTIVVEGARESIRKQTELHLNGLIPTDLRPIFTASIAFPLAKEDGSPRPVGCGAGWRRFFTKVAVEVSVSSIEKKLKCSQYAIGMKAGMEKMIH